MRYHVPAPYVVHSIAAIILLHFGWIYEIVLITR